MSSQKKKKIGIIAALVVLVIGLYFGYEHFTYVQTDNAQIEAHSLLMASKVGGFIKSVYITDGQKVKKDQILVEIDARDFQNSLSQAKAELASLNAKKADLEKNFYRVSELYKKNVVSQQQFDAAGASLKEVKAKSEAVAAVVAQAELNLENSKLKAPSDGVIAKKSAEVGQLAAPGVPLVGFVDSSSRWVTANFKETEIASIKVGALVDVSVDAVSGHSFKGQVESISSATGATFALLPPDNATGNFTKVVQRVPVKIKLLDLSADDIDSLRAGLSAIVKVHKH